MSRENMGRPWLDGERTSRPNGMRGWRGVLAQMRETRLLGSMFDFALDMRRRALRRPYSIVIAERFATTAHGLSALQLPDDLVQRTRGRRLRVIVSTETGNIWR